MTSSTYYSIAIRGVSPGAVPMSLHYQVEKGELFVSPHCRLCGISAMACIATRQDAEAFRALLLPAFVDRYGPTVTLEVQAWTSSAPTIADVVAGHTAIVRARVADQNSAPNRPPMLVNLAGLR